MGGIRRISRGARRKIFHHALAGTAQQNRFQLSPQFVQVLVAHQFAFFIHHLVAVKKPKGRPQPPVVDKFHHRKQFLDPVFQRGAGQDQRKGGLQSLDHPAGFGLPVLDALPFVKNDQVPLDPLDGQQITQDLLVVADCKKTVVAVLGRPLLGAAQHELAAATAEAFDFNAPLGFQRRRADHQYLGDRGMTRQQFGNADALDGFSQPHVIGQDRPPDADGKGDAIQLVGEQLGLQQIPCEAGGGPGPCESRQRPGPCAVEKASGR